jgi:hypothetical protein
LKKDAEPFQGRYYNIPKAFESSTRKEVDRMCDIDVLRKLTYDDDSPWAAPSFAQIKKTGDVRILTDFRKMNLAIEQKPFHYLELENQFRRSKSSSQLLHLIYHRDIIQSLLMRKLKRSAPRYYHGASTHINV